MEQNNLKKSSLNRNKPEIIFNNKNVKKHGVKKNLSKVENYAEFEFFAGKKSQNKQEKDIENLNVLKKDFSQDKNQAVKNIIEKTLKSEAEKLDIKKIKPRVAPKTLALKDKTSQKTVSISENSIIEANNKKVVKKIVFKEMSIEKQKSLINKVKREFELKRLSLMLEERRKYNPNYSLEDLRNEHIPQKYIDKVKVERAKCADEAYAEILKNKAEQNTTAEHSVKENQVNVSEESNSLVLNKTKSKSKITANKKKTKKQAITKNSKITTSKIKSEFGAELNSNTFSDESDNSILNISNENSYLSEASNFCVSADVERIINIARIGALFDCVKF